MKIILNILIFLLHALLLNAKKSNNWAILLDTSKFWFNYRQTANTLMIYEIIKKNGIPDENIIMMIPDNIACNSRNNNPCVISVEDNKLVPNIFENVEIDHKGLEVNVENFLNAIRQRHNPNTPLAQQLRTDNESTVFIYMNGHGGNGYHKMQDTHVISDYEFAKAIEELYAKKGFKKMLILSDSCGAFTMFDQLNVPNIYMIGSSSKDEKSYSYGRDSLLGMSKTDEFTYKTYHFALEHIDASIDEFMSIMDPVILRGHPGVKNTFLKRTGKDIYLSEFLTNRTPKKTKAVNFGIKKESNPDQGFDFDFMTELEQYFQHQQQEKEKEVQAFNIRNDAEVKIPEIDYNDITLNKEFYLLKKSNSLVSAFIL